MKIKNILLSKSGSILVQTAGIALSMMILFSFVYQFSRVILISGGVKEEVQNSAISAVTENYYPSFNGMREGNSGAYILSGGAWNSCLNESNIKSYLISNYSLTSAGDTLEKNEQDGSLQYSISNINASYENCDFATNDNSLKATVDYTINIPIKFFVGNVTTFSLTKQTEVEFEQKF